MHWLGSWVGDWFAEWFGAAAPAPPGAISGALSGTGTCSGTLSSTGTPIDPPASGGGGIVRRLSRRLLDLWFRRPLAARLAGSSRLRATLTATPWARTHRGITQTRLALLLAESDDE